MTTLHEEGPQPQVFELAVDVQALARELAAEVVTHLSRDENTPEGYVNVKRALEWLGWGPKGRDRLYALVKADEIPFHRPPGSNLLYFRLSELDTWMSDRGGLG